MKYEIRYNNGHGVEYWYNARTDKELSQVLSELREKSGLSAKGQVCSIGRIKSVANSGLANHWMSYRYEGKQEIMVLVNPQLGTEYRDRYGLKVRYRAYKCDCCGHRTQLQTNHTGNCYGYCKNCSWHSAYDSQKNYYRADIHKQRPHYYVGEEVKEEEINPYSIMHIKKK